MKQLSQPAFNQYQPPQFQGSAQLPQIQQNYQNGQQPRTIQGMNPGQVQGFYQSQNPSMIQSQRSQPAISSHTHQQVQLPSQQNQNASLIVQQIMMMQKQMEMGFTKMCEKIEDIEGRVDNASNQLQFFEKQQQENLRNQEQKDKETQQQFRRLSETIQSQGQFTRAPLDDYNPTYDQREPRFRPQDQYQQNQVHGASKSPSRHVQSKLTLIWNKVLEHVKKRQFEDAYRLTLKEADDIYLIRLVAQTGPVVKQLEDRTAFQVINRINKIIRSGAFEAMEIEWIEDANRRGLFQQLNKHEQNEYLDTLFQFQQSKLNPKISDRAQEVYAQIKMNSTNAKDKQKR